MAERLVRLSKKRSYEKGKRMSESLTERFQKLYKKRKSQQLSREFKIPKYDMEAASQQITEDNNQSDGSFNRLQRELNLFGYSTSSNAVSVKQFLSSITEGPYYVSTCCNRMLYRKTVRKFQYSAYPRDIFTGIMSFDNVKYICVTCHLKAKKGQIPCQAVCNKIDIDEIPSELEALRKLESVLVAQRLVFKRLLSCLRVSLRRLEVLSVISELIVILCVKVFPGLLSFVALFY